MEQFLKKGALFLEKLNFRIFPLILLLKILSILSSFSGEKGSERFAEPQNRTLNLPNLYFCPKNRTSNLSNLKKPNGPPNRTRFVPSLQSMRIVETSNKQVINYLFQKETSTAIGALLLTSSLINFFFIIYNSC